MTTTMTMTTVLAPARTGALQAVPTPSLHDSVACCHILNGKVMQDLSNVRRSIITGDERHQGISDRLARLEVGIVFIGQVNPVPVGTPDILVPATTILIFGTSHVHIILRSSSRRSDAKGNIWYFVREVSLPFIRLLSLMPLRG